MKFIVGHKLALVAGWFVLPLCCGVAEPGHFHSAQDVPVVADGFMAAGEAQIELDFVPPAGTQLSIVNNNGLAPIVGRFANLGQGREIVLSYSGRQYRFVVDYVGGDGNDLILRWAATRFLSWGYNGYGQLGIGGASSFLRSYAGAEPNSAR